MAPIVERSINLGTTKMKYHFHEGNARDVVVLLHPWFGCWQFWTSTIKVLRQRCYAVDLYSVGNGEWSNFGTPIGLATAVMLLLNHEKLNRVSLVGNSMGGIVAQIVAATCPEKIKKLVLIGTGATTANLQREYVAAIRRWMDAPNRRNSAEMLGRLIARRPDARTFSRYLGSLIAANMEFMKSVLSHATNLDLRPILKNIKSPTLIIRGGLDQGRTRNDVKTLLKHIRTSRAVELSSAGHSPMVDSFDKFAHELTSFLNGY